MMKQNILQHGVQSNDVSDEKLVIRSMKILILLVCSLEVKITKNVRISDDLHAILKYCRMQSEGLTQSLI